MDNSDYSDSSDEDYVPNEGEVLSEEEDSGEDEQFIPGEDDEDDDANNKESCILNSESLTQPKKTRKRTGCHKSGSSKLKKRTNSNQQMLAVKSDEDIKADREIKEQQEKNKTNALWADFMKDVDTSKLKPKLSSNSITNKDMATDCKSSTSSLSSTSSAATKEKITVVKEYDFAGETVVVTQELDANCKEAKRATFTNASKTETEPVTVTSSSSSSGSLPVTTALKRPSGGLNSVLGKLNKKPKMSTLDKSKLDWDGFKQKEGINDELKIHNRGKEGYLERVAFLERADQRQFEIERKLRLGSAQKP